jgi:hypothetical protein
MRMGSVQDTYMTFRIGQQVECIDDLGFEYSNGEQLPVKGSVYSIREIDAEMGLETALRFEELKNKRGHYIDQSSECCFLAWRFRPVVRTDISIFTSMLAPKKASVIERGFSFSR